MTIRTYGNRPLGEVWLRPDDGPYDKPQTEMRVSALALARLGYENVALEGRNPPNPDIFADSRGTGPLAIEVTLNFDQDESQFQGSGAKSRMLNGQAAGIPAR